MTPARELEARRRALAAMAAPQEEELEVSPVPVADGLPTPAYRPLAAPRELSPEVRAYVEGKATPPDEYQQARESTRERRLAQAILGIGQGLNTALTGSQAPGGFDVDAPMDDLAAVRAERAQQAELARKAALSDPNSPASIRLKALLGATGAGFAPGVLSQLTAQDGEGAFEAAKLRLSDKARTDSAVAAERKRVADLAEKKRQEAVAEARRLDDWEKRSAEGGLNRSSHEKAAAITAGDKATQQKLELEGHLRKEVSSDPSVKSYQEAAIAFDKMQRAAADESAAGDLALIFAFMKTLDPGSTVREGEFANAQNAAGVPERILNAYNKARSGERLSPGQRAEFIGTAYSQFMAAKKRADSVLDDYGGLARDVGAKPERVVLPGTRVDVDLMKPPSRSAPARTEGPSAKPQQLADVPLLKLSPGQRASDVIPEGEMRRVNMGGGKVRLVVKRNGKLKVVE